MSDWRKILVEVLKEIKTEYPITNLPLRPDQLTDAERDSLAAAVREAEGK
jgi:hypothetical protein